MAITGILKNIFPHFQNLNLTIFENTHTTRLLFFQSEYLKYVYVINKQLPSLAVVPYFFKVIDYDQQLFI